VAWLTFKTNFPIISKSNNLSTNYQSTTKRI
ncbi:MAG: hypothetical protein ACI9JY_001421, partial [Saprospiraceae bacterium]